MKVFKIKLRNKQSPVWYYKVKTHTGEYKRFKGYSDKRATEERAANHQADIDKGIVGIVDVYKAHKAKPIKQHFADYLSELTSTGHDSINIEILDLRLSKMANLCQWQRLGDIDTQSFIRFRDTGDIAKLSPKTRNDYHQTIRQFCRWCVKNGRLPIDPFQNLATVKVNGDIRRQRRALTDTEVNRLLSVSPEPRRTVYMLALLTGLRRNEIRQLKWTDINLQAVKPFVMVRASTTKNGKQAVMFLREDLTEALRRLPQDRDTVCRCPKIITFYKDLNSAGIDRKDKQGRIVDFHSLRHTLATNCARNNVPLRTAMEVMRHSDIRLTTKTYTDASLLPTADAIDSLPKFNINPEIKSAKTA